MSLENCVQYMGWLRFFGKNIFDKFLFFYFHSILEDNPLEMNFKGTLSSTNIVLKNFLFSVSRGVAGPTTRSDTGEKNLTYRQQSGGLSGCSSFNTGIDLFYSFCVRYFLNHFFYSSFIFPSCFLFTFSPFYTCVFSLLQFL
jgi:hypothetical protein